jgi:hypothetical protein
LSPFIRPHAVQGGDRIAALSVFLILLSLYTATFTGLPEVPESELEFQTTSALFRTGSFALGGTPEAENALRAEAGVVRDEGGVARSVHGSCGRRSRSCTRATHAPGAGAASTSRTSRWAGATRC